MLADRFGGKWVLGLGVLLWSVFTLLTPPAAATGLIALVVCRFFMGVAEAVTWPSIYALYSQWVSDTRRATAVGFMNSGVAGGSVIALVATPLIIAAYSWQLAFYIYGAIGIVWFLIWTPTTRSSPAGTANDSSDEHCGAKSDFPKITLVALLQSRAVWAIAVAHMCLNWTIFLMLSWLPTYINKGLGADFSQIGMLAVAPAVVAMLLTPVAGRVFDILISRGFNRLRVRKVMQSLAFGSIAFTFAILGYVESVLAGILLVTFSNAMTACSAGGFATNHLEIAPNQSGLLMGLTNTLGSLSSGLAILISGIVLDVTGSWVVVFQLAAAIAILGAVFYWRFASIEREFY
jgi:ACS family sodium-dependent inorganic phosphate cotransporter